MKKIIVALISVIIASAAFMGGCVNVSGVDIKGLDGKNASAYEFYELAKSQDPDLTIDEFLKKYLSYTDTQAFALQGAINRSLMSGVSVVACFETVSYDLFGRPIKKSVASFGSGVITELDKENGDAYVVTNCHVVYNDTAVNSYVSDEIYLYLYGQDDDYNDRDYAIPATVVGVSSTYDIALLKVEGSEILRSGTAVAAEFDDADDVYVGETVYAIGNPERLGIAATQGIISKDSETIRVDISSSDYNQNIKTYRVIRTDAAINGGNSGGGLFNLEGKLAGIVNAKAASEDIDNMGYALPSSNVRRLVELMHSQGYDGETGVEQAYLNASFSAKNRKTKYENDKLAIYETVYVTAAGDGLLAEDAVRHVKITDAQGNIYEDMDVTRLYHLDDALLSARLGYTVTLTVSREGKTVEVPITLTKDNFINYDKI